MSDISRVVMDALRRQLRDLEFDAVLIRGKVEQLHATIDWLENGELPRGRPPKPKKSEVVEMPLAALNPYPSQIMEQSASARATPPLQMPLRTKGGMACAEADLPSLDDVRGILKPDGAAA